MAKAKGLMASGQTGKLDNVVYYKGANGDTIARKLVIPKNPNTLAQRYQRVIIKTVNKNYQVFKALADHAFEGKTMGAQCMNRFMQLNARMLRSRAVELQMAGQSLAQFYSFMPLKSDHYTPAAVFISEGSLPQVPVTINPNCAFALSANTYAAICEQYGLRRGDQLTFCVVGVDEVTGENILRYARVILDPRNADGSGAAMSSPFIVDGRINLPNFRNAGVFTDIMFDTNEVVFNTVNGDPIAAGIIVSRKDDKKYWYRSSCKLVISEANMTDKVSLEEAAADLSGELDLINEEAYLNNAGTGGAQGEETQVNPNPTTPVISNTAQINGVSQSIAGGSVTVTAPLSSVELNGQHLGNVDAMLKVGTTVYEPAKSATYIRWSGLSIPAGSTAEVRVGQELLVTIIVQEGGSVDPEPEPSVLTITSANGQAASKGGSITDSVATLSLQGTNMTGTWKATLAGAEVATGNVMGTTQVDFSGLNTDGTYTITCDGVSVFTYVKASQPQPSGPVITSLNGTTVTGSSVVLPQPTDRFRLDGSNMGGQWYVYDSNNTKVLEKYNTYTGFCDMSDHTLAAGVYTVTCDGVVVLTVDIQNPSGGGGNDEN